MLQNLIAVILSLASFQLFAQNRFHLIDETGKSMPLSKIYLGGKVYFSNATGEIEIDSSSKKTYSDYTFSEDTLVWHGNFYLTKLSFTDQTVKNLVKSIVKSKWKNDLKSFAPFSYDSYNKFTIHSTKIHEGEKLLSKWLDKFNIELKTTEENRHLVISESFSTRNYYDHLHENEIVKWSKFSGVDQTLFLSLNSQLQTIDVYEKHLRVLSSKNVNPFHNQTMHGYNFILADTLEMENEILVKICFYPKKLTRFEAIKGFAWVNVKQNVIAAMYCEPVYGRRMQNSYAIEFTKLEEKYVPKIICTSLVLDNISTSKLKIIARQTSYINNFNQHDHTIIKKQFSHLALSYRTQQLDSVDRAIPLSKLDSNTYNYFSKDKNLRINSSIKWGEQLYFGKFHTKYIDINLNQLVDYNTHEALRIGYSFNSNESLSKKLIVKHYFAYGFGDKAWKGGLSMKFHLIDEDKLTWNGFVYNDIYEAGKLDKTLAKAFYSTEFMRKFHIYEFNQQQHAGFNLTAKPYKYLSLDLIFDFYKDKALYAYQFLDGTKNNFREMRLSLRYAYGERYFRFYDENISFKTDYPVLWLNVEKNLPNSDFSYTRIQFRGRYTHNFIMNGTSKIEFIAGQYFGQLPYFKLFNGLGSASLKATIHSAFETMNYNEFISDRFGILFFTHDFGHFNLSKKRTFRPHIEFDFNYGIGTLRNPERQQGKILKTFNKGYSEVGLSVKDLLLFYPFGVKIGLGASFYHRLLFYRYPTFKENSIFKITTGFLI